MERKNSESKKSKDVCSGNDYFSSLPDELILRIIFLTQSYKVAVRCSTLSKRWLNLYTMMNGLAFDETDLVGEITPRKVDMEMLLSQSRRRRLFRRIIADALFRHKGNIDRFSLTMRGNMSSLEWCLDYISNYPIRILNLWSTHENSRLEEFPFNCRKLEVLNLLNVECQPQLDNLGFPNLLECFLAFSKYDRFWYNEFLPKCPELYLLDLEAPFSSEHSPFTLSSPSLESLDLRPLDSHHDRRAVEIHVNAPLLSELLLDCKNFHSKVKLRVQSSSLNQISVISSKTTDLLPWLECKEIQWTDEVLVNRAKWDDDMDLVYLDMQSARPDGLLGIVDICRYYMLEVLLLSNTRIYPMQFWKMLAKLPLLESLTLSKCTFEDGDFDVFKEEDVDIEGSDMSGEENLDYRGGLNISEVEFSFTFLREDDISGTKEEDADFEGSNVNRVENGSDIDLDSGKTIGCARECLGLISSKVKTLQKDMSSKQSEDCDSKEECLNPEASNKNGMDTLSLMERCYGDIGLTDVNIVMDKTFGRVFSTGEKRMLQLFWENAKCLRNLTVSIVMQQYLDKDEYLAFFWGLIICDYNVKLCIDRGSSVVFELARKKPE